MKPPEIRKLLIANRGEIAVRIQRSAKEMGIRTVAVFSDVDRCAPHVLGSDEAYPLQGNSSRETYLDADKIIDIGRKTNCDAIHPGYGFLSENADFAQATISAGMIFVGPPPDAMRMMGSKTHARNLMIKAKVPVVPGTPSYLKNYDEALEAARTIGFPILLKAVHGGGGKGMRKVATEKELQASFEQARSESLAAFKSDEIFLEKYLVNPRHIEIQILADAHGSCIFLGERECSIQRRHQKVIEECPSSKLSDDTKNAMGSAAIQAAKACGYVNAGTIEFMVDESEAFYFLEMNTRLQVEHPTTELVYRLDLVKEQIKIAQGGKLSLTQRDIVPEGHAIECRICAEDPYNGFLPSTGIIEEFTPSEGIGVRNDSGAHQGSEISLFYDSLLAKLITWGEDREEARRRMIRALSEYKISGVATTIPLCAFVLSHPQFIEGKYNINFLEDFFNPNRLTPDHEIDMVASFVAASLYHNRQNESIILNSDGATVSAWKRGRLEE
ncbi:MAG TPA: acetyl-CoA carboxylase biotin carboxylase subunit [Bacteroidota bacterium]|nr:acetyl-CoA carboxylase biotin carboxylase subunit [Bacteroidota bacterium]